MIGYNDEKAKELMNTIAKSYAELGDCMTDGWPTVSTTMNNNWIGMDERDYETKLAKRMCELYINAYTTVSELVKSIKGLADSWYTFQKNNKMSDSDGGSGSSASSGSSAAVEDNPNVPSVTVEQKSVADIIKANTDAISASVDKGIKQGGGQAIKTCLKTYHDNVQEKVKALYNKIDSSNAFLGTQATKINEYIKTIGICVAKMTTEIKDIYDCVDKLTDGATGNYTESNTTVSNSVETAKNKASGTKFNNIQ